MRFVAAPNAKTDGNASGDEHNRIYNLCNLLGITPSQATLLASNPSGNVLLACLLQHQEYFFYSFLPVLDYVEKAGFTIFIFVNAFLATFGVGNMGLEGT